MPHDIRIPRLGWSMEEGTFVRWLKAPGERVAPGEPLFELEGEKSVEPVESIDGGILHVPADAPGAGAVVKVGTLVGWLLADGEAPPAPTPVAPPAVAPAPPPPSTAAGAARPAPRPSGPVGGPSSPTIRRLARELGVDLAAVAGSGPTGRILADDVFAAAVARVPAAGGSRGRRASTPRARAAAARLGIDWRDLAGSGRGGRVREADVLAAPRSAASAPHRPTASPFDALPKRRRAIAERMLASTRDNAPVTLHCRADVSTLVAYRARQKAGSAAPPAYTDLVAKIVAAALVRHPALAGCWDAHGTLVLPDADGIHVGIAVDTDAGLLVPVVRDVGRRTLAEVAAESRALVERARTGRLQAADMEGGVFTITNLGASGVDEFTPIVNPPQTAILGLGAIRREPVVARDAAGQESIVVRERVALSLTFDHCRVDGAPAARFLDDVRRGIESPDGVLG